MRPESLEDSAAIIESFLSGSCGDYDWDDFLTIPSPDPLIQAVKNYCADSHFHYPPSMDGHWCSETGALKLTQLSVHLRTGSMQAVADFLQKEHKRDSQT